MIKTILIYSVVFLGFVITAYAQHDLNILNFNGDTGFVHDSKPIAEKMIEELGIKNNWKITTTSNPAIFSTADLSTFDVVVFNNNCGTDGPIFNRGEQKGIQHYIRSGGSFVGIHCAGAIWGETGEFQEWYEKLVGAKLIAHPHVQKATLNIENRNHICTLHLPVDWEITDEWHQFENNPRKNVNVLISLDESSYSGKEKMNGDHPAIWVHEYDGGRSFFTTIGHTVEVYKDENYRKLVEGGIMWAANVDGEYDFNPIVENLVLDLNADHGVVLEDGDKVSKWTNQVATSPARDFAKNDTGRTVVGSGRPRLKINTVDIRDHNTVIFHRQELVNDNEDAFDHLITGSGYTWFSVMAVYRQVPGVPDVSAFFGNLRNSNLDDKGLYEGFWGGLSDDNRVWMGTRNGVTFGRWDENNPHIIDSKPLKTGQYYLVMGRMGAGTDVVKLELFINTLTPVAEGLIPVNTDANPSKMVIGQERDATNHPGKESFDGEIARFLLYDRPLSDEEMKNMTHKLLLDYHIQQ